MSNAPAKSRDGPLTATKAAEALGVHNNTVKRIPASELPFFRIGGRGDRRYRQQDIDAYIIRNTEGR